VATPKNSWNKRNKYTIYVIKEIFNITQLSIFEKSIRLKITLMAGRK
jgi:hypothetical protein